MEHFLIVTNDGKDADGRVTAKVKQLLTDAGKTCVLCEKDGDKKIIREKIPEKIDCAVVIGGDGSLIEVARFLHGRNIPVLGINLGRTGFLATCELDEMDEKLTRLARGEFRVEHRALLQAECTGADKPLVALNDLVIYSGQRRQTVDLDIYCDGRAVSNCRGDGVILATPTGSTAYSLSAGGPILDARIRGLVVTSICAHSLQRPAIVFAADRRITVKAAPDQRGPILVSSDGEQEFPLPEGGELHAELSEINVKFITFIGTYMFDAIDKKLRGR